MSNSTRGLRRACVVIALVALVAGCSKVTSPTQAEQVTQQDMLTRMTVAAGYEVAGVPQYAGGRWTSNVRIPGCAADITVVAAKTDEAILPSSFTVTAVGGMPLDNLSPGTNGLFLTAQNLRALDGAQGKLNCAPEPSTTPR